MTGLFYHFVSINWGLIVLIGKWYEEQVTNAKSKIWRKKLFLLNMLKVTAKMKIYFYNCEPTNKKWIEYYLNSYLISPNLLK